MEQRLKARFVDNTTVQPTSIECDPCRSTRSSTRAADREPQYRDMIASNVREILCKFSASIPQRTDVIAKKLGLAKVHGKLWIIEEGGICAQITVAALLKRFERELHNALHAAVTEFQRRQQLVLEEEVRSQEMLARLKQFAALTMQRALEVKIDTSTAARKTIEALPNSQVEFDQLTGIFANSADGKLYSIDDFGIFEVNEREKQVLARQTRTLNLTQILPIHTRYNQPVEDLQYHLGRKSLANKAPTHLAVHITNECRAFYNSLKSVLNTCAETISSPATPRLQGVRIVFVESGDLAGTAAAQIEKEDAKGLLVILSIHNEREPALPPHWTVLKAHAPIGVTAKPQLVEWLLMGALSKRKCKPQSIQAALPLPSPILPERVNAAAASLSPSKPSTARPVTSAPATNGPPPTQPATTPYPTEASDIDAAVSLYAQERGWHTVGSADELKQVFLSEVVKDLKATGAKVNQGTLANVLRRLGFQVKRPANRMCVEVFVSTARN